MEVSLRTVFHAIQGLLFQMKNLEESLNGDQTEESAEDYLFLEHVQDALDELATIYTEHILENHIINFPSFEKLKDSILWNSNW